MDVGYIELVFTRIAIFVSADGLMEETTRAPRSESLIRGFSMVYYILIFDREALARTDCDSVGSMNLNKREIHRRVVG